MVDGETLLGGQVTVGISCYNAADTIRRAVAAGLGQEWPDLDLVVVDDCSTDGSWDIVKEIAATESRLRIFRHERNRGYPAVLNTIVSHARGDFLAFVDDDDRSAPDRVSKQIERIVSYENGFKNGLVLCYTNRGVVLAGQNRVDHIAQAIGRSSPEPRGRPVADFVLGLSSERPFVWGMFGSGTLMARRMTFERIGPFDEQFRRSAELDYAVRAALLGASFISVDEPLVTQFKTPSEDKAGTKPLRYNLLLREKHRDYLTQRRAYSASVLLAHSAFHGNKRNNLRTSLFKALAFISSPTLLLERLGRRFRPVATSDEQLSSKKVGQ